MNTIRRAAPIALVALVATTLLAAPAVAADTVTTAALQDDSMNDTDSMGDGTTNDSMQDDSMGDGTTNDSMQDDSMTDSDGDENASAGTDAAETTSSSGPGFTAGLALVALFGAALLAARRRA